MRLCLLVMSETTSVKSTWLSEHDLNKDNNSHAKVDREKCMSLYPHTKNYRQLRNVESEKNSLPRDEYINWLSILVVGRLLVSKYNHIETVLTNSNFLLDNSYILN